jgi:quinol monooxygenase YgiN
MIGHVTLKPGLRVHYIEAFRRIAPRVRAEPGCIEYEIYIDSEDPAFDNERRTDTVVIVEKWDSISALLAHSKAEAVQELRKQIRDMRLMSSYELVTMPAGSER